MDKEIIEKLSALSEEEKQILQGRKSILRSDYSSSEDFIVNEKKLLPADRQLDLRRHTRFIDFPDHGHDFMEFTYVYAGSITHVVNKEKIVLQCGDILFLNRHIRHSILKTGAQDIGINFVASDSFLKYILHNVRNNPIMYDFLKRNFDDAGDAEYLHFRTKDTFPIRNLMDNLIYAIVKHRPNDYEILTQLVSLLFSYLASYENTLANNERISSPDTRLKQDITAYLEGHYPDATLCDLSKQTGYCEPYLSRKIRALFGKTFRELLCKQRLSVATNLLSSTNLSVEEIISTIGYENQSHFHKMFRNQYKMTPRQYRLLKK